MAILSNQRGSTALFFVALVSMARVAAQPTDQAPASRTAEIERERDVKQAALAPEEVSKAERFLRDLKDKGLLERTSRGYNGFRAKIGNLVTGGGFALGPEYFREDFLQGNLSIRASAQASTRKYTKFEFAGALPKLWNGRAQTGLLASRRDYSGLNFYGTGPNSAKTGRSNYRLEDVSFDVFGTLEPSRWTKVGASTGKLWVNVGPGIDHRFVSTDRLYTEAQLPGIQRQTDFLRTSLFGQFDYRDDPVGPKAGGNYVFEYTWYADTPLNAYGFRRMDIDVQQFVPFLNKTRRFVLRAKGTFTESDAGQQTPFYLRPILGGSDDLRGFRPFRFNDRNMVVYNAEYQWEIFSGLDGAVFGDAGKVMPRRSLLRFSDLETSVGFGLRFNAKNATFMRVDVGFSHEGFQVWLKFNDVFNSRRFGTNVAQPVY